MSLWQKKSAVSAANEWSLNSLLQPVQAEIIPFNKLNSNCIDPVSVVFSSNAGELALTRLLALFIGSCDSLAPCISFTCVFTRTHPSVDLFLLVTGAFFVICGSADKCTRYLLPGAARSREWRHRLQVSGRCRTASSPHSSQHLSLVFWCDINQTGFICSCIYLF